MTHSQPAPLTTTRVLPSARADGAGHLLGLIRSAQTATVSEMAAGLGASRSTVMVRLQALVDAGLVVAKAPANGARGRPATSYVFDPSSAALLAAQLGMTGCRLAVTDLAGEILGSRYIDVDLRLGPARLTADMIAAYDDILGELGREPSAVVGIGLGMPSSIEMLSYSRSLGVTGADWDDSGIIDELSRRYDAPAFVDLDVNLLALAERRTTWPDVEVFVCVKLGTLIDAAIVVNDTPIRGVGNAAGALGHLKVAGSVEPCTCGGIGCLDAVAGGGALVKQLQAAGFDITHVSDVIRLVNVGQPEALLAVREAGRRIGEALSTIVNLLNPAVISTWGYLTGAESVLFAGIREGLYQSALPRSSEDLQLIVTALGESAGVRGAAMRVIDEVLEPSTLDRSLESGRFPSRR
ncbi:putative NBD/HSP70 family sugar kinase [Labedella gwakjiensis]|uniref:Putative NBD/HSP70 family sugar kinase n=1 Tax=Labedella gwakjiensis TaxID=390269 RepID=A0A2P8GUT6_9MICO|nr:ROK family transcriptional regulator [Labedella gwakjiensis]PSL37715.1 putative NBD/HSP70 family sugar kinase [Labedella gwakjiensis]RUQ87692.1 ROK family transcriptional regulator [Labedella gwakjiensis]